MGTKKISELTSGTLTDGDIVLGNEGGVTKALTSATDIVQDTTPVLGGDLDGGTNDITNVGTVDGRTVATDGTKLDGIEALADVTDETNVTAALDGATLTGVTVGGTDKVILQDVSDSDNIKTVTAQSIADLATHTPEGTAVLSTGEVAGTKFLREDGDGTCSWQAPTGGGDMVLADVQTVTGAKTFNSTKMIHAGSSSGTTTVNATAVAGTTTLTLPAATDTLTGKATTDTLTNKTLDGAASGTNTISNLPYDVAFNAGFDATSVKEDVAVQTYAELVMARSGEIVGEAGYADTAPTGAALILDIQKNGTTVYSTLPQFAIAATSLTAGTLKTDGTEDFVSGDRITFKITQIGSTEPGEGIRFTAKTEV